MEAPANRPLKVLISAYACEPVKGSEPGVGWQWVRQIARFHETWVITRANNRDSIEEDLRQHPVNNLNFVFIDLPRWARFWKKGHKGIHFYYCLWQILAFKTAVKLHSVIRFDLVHHLTLGNMLLPTFVSILPIPFIWGPVGGAEQIPKSFRKNYPEKTKQFEKLRESIIRALMFNILFLYSCKKARRIITKTHATSKNIPDHYKSRVTKITDVGVSRKDFVKKKTSGDFTKIIAVGRLDAWRGFDLLIKAVSHAVTTYPKMYLEILGDGYDMARLQKICIEKKLEKHVVLRGHVDRNTYLECMSTASIFVNPSLKEASVTSFFDAMLMGIPVICLDVGGCSEFITKDIGIKIKPLSPAQTIKGLSRAILRYVGNEQLRKTVGESARQRVISDFNWDKKGEAINSVYLEALSN